MLDIRGLNLLKNGVAPTDAEWVSLIETRVEMMKPFLNFVPTEALNRVKCVHNGTSLCNLSDLQRRAESQFGFRVNFVDSAKEKFDWHGLFRGILSLYSANWMPRVTCVIGAKLVLWGLLRNGKWLGAFADFDITDYGHSHPYLVFKALDIRETNPTELLELEAIAGFGLFGWLGSQFQNWFRGYDERYWKARNLSLVFEAEDALVTPLVT